MRLPLQLGRASLNQGTRYAACVWLGPLLLIIAAMFQQTFVLSAFVFGIPAFFFMAAAFMAAENAKADRASDIVLDGAGFSVEGGPLDKLTCTWPEVRGCTIVDGEARTALRWLVASWVTGRRIASINGKARVAVKQLQLERNGKDMAVLAEAEGDEIESLEQLRDSIRAAMAPPTEPPPLPQEVLACPRCSAPQVPVAAARMACSSCGHEMDVPAELQQRVRASLELDDRGTRERVVRELVDQPSARRAAAVIAGCRRLMVWIQPVALGLWIAMLIHSTNTVAKGDIWVARVSPDDDGMFFYDLGLFVLVVASAFAIAWAVGHAYIANRQALRMLAGNFGAVPPVKPGAPSTCRHCDAPLPDTKALVVHCAYCATENVLGVDPRPAAMRHRREGVDLARGLRRRRRAQIARWTVIPIAAVLGVAMAREVRVTWHVPGSDSVAYMHFGCDHACATITNTDLVRRTFTIVSATASVETTVLPRGKVDVSCDHGCSLDGAGQPRVIDDGRSEQLRIEHGALVGPQ